MNINPTSVNFQGRAPQLRTSRFGLITKDGNVMNVEVLGDLSSKVTSIKCSTVDAVKNYQNKKGFSLSRILKISEEMQKNVKDGFDFLAEFIKAQKI